MVASIVGDYLVSKELITREQLEDTYKEQQKVRVKLGLIAVAEGLMSQEETYRVNQLQSVMDKRFGDIAVEKGYLTAGQVESLLKKQGNAYLTFAQALEDQQLMTIEQLEHYMVDYSYEHNFTPSNMEDLKSDDVDRIVPLYLPLGSEKYQEIAGTAIRTFMRLVDQELYPDPAAIKKLLKADQAATQLLQGAKGAEDGIMLSLSGEEDALLYTASVFGQEEFSEVNEDALDAIGELLNCINGLYASAEEKEGHSLELMPPEFKTGLHEVESKEMLVIPLNIKGKKVNLAIAVGNEIFMS